MWWPLSDLRRGHTWGGGREEKHRGGTWKSGSSNSQHPTGRSGRPLRTQSHTEPPGQEKPSGSAQNSPALPVTELGQWVQRELVTPSSSWHMRHFLMTTSNTTPHLRSWSWYHLTGPSSHLSYWHCRLWAWSRLIHIKSSEVSLHINLPKC